MKQYIGTKIIQAEPATKGQAAAKRMGLKVEDCPDTLAGMKEDGYRIIYHDGYESWSPKDVFEAAYRATDGMNFGLAIEAAKMGKKIAREGWNGKGMFLYHVPAAAYPPSTEVAKEAFCGSDVPYGAYIAMKTAQGNVVPWLASQTDMLADDWRIVE